MCNKHGTNIINANNIGNNTVQQNDINWSKRILGKDALTQMKINTIIELLIPKVKLDNNPSTEELVNNSLNLKYSDRYYSFYIKYISINSNLINQINKYDQILINNLLRIKYLLIYTLILYLHIQLRRRIRI